ncbi:hypothetical protein SAMN05660766_0412 [Curtobacterium sp. 314Chir4.1]|jgi:hypothetical protein|uniref:hypothetical protein n=1 Tax=Curtobacterium TaxID=2034 RepID=UPI000BC82929|nr:hypothetical protein [Curtobacterium sp. 314Chir4.1]SOC86755.1 hypothetical protein SAMN05660766_0412 [Curtobacterium sp. 314Chir4.1]
MTTPVARSSNSGLAIAGLVLGIVGLVLAFFIPIIGLILGIIGLVLALVARNRGAGSRGVLLGGIIISAIAIVAAIANWIIGAMIVANTM